MVAAGVAAFAIPVLSACRFRVSQQENRPAGGPEAGWRPRPRWRAPIAARGGSRNPSLCFVGARSLRERGRRCQSGAGARFYLRLRSSESVGGRSSCRWRDYWKKPGERIPIGTGGVSHNPDLPLWEPRLMARRIVKARVGVRRRHVHVPRGWCGGRNSYGGRITQR